MCVKPQALQSLLYILCYTGCPAILEDRYILRGYDETEGKRPDITLLKVPNYPGPLLLDISLIQSFPGSRDSSRPLPTRAIVTILINEIFLTILINELLHCHTTK